MLKNMKIGKKLILTFLFVTLLSSVGGIVGFVMMRNMDVQYSSALTNYGFSQGDIGLFNAEFNYSRSTLRDVILLTDADSLKTSTDNLSNAFTILSQYLTKMKSNMVNNTEMSYYNTIKESLENYESSAKECFR